MMLVFFIMLAAMAYISEAARSAGTCAMQCNDMRLDVLTLEMCREAKRTLPRPKVGDFCSIAMEQGFSDVCVALCMGQQPVARVAQTCRSAAIEMPRPTVRKWCEHGYNVAYEKTFNDLQNYFKKIDAEKASEDAARAELANAKAQAAADEQAAAAAAAEAEAAKAAAAAAAAAVPEKAIVATIPVTLNENETYDLTVREGQNVEDAVVQFCRKHVSSDVAACIRQLLPDILERYNSEANNLRGGA